jgi:hypothetical protein
MKHEFTTLKQTPIYKAIMATLYIVHLFTQTAEAKKIMASVFWDNEGVLMPEYLYRPDHHRHGLRTPQNFTD